MTESRPPEPTDPAPAPSSLSRADLLDLCASMRLDGSAGAAGSGEHAGASDEEVELRAAIDAAGITEAEIAARRERFATTREALLAGDEGRVGERDDDLERARRLRAVRAAIDAAAADEPVEPTSGADRDDRLRRAPGGVHRPAAVGPADGGGLRRVAVAAAAVLVVAGVGGLALGGLGGGGSEDSAGSAPETADAAADGTADAAPDGDGAGSQDFTGAPSGVAADQPRAESFAEGSDWVELGQVPTAEEALAAWRRVRDAGAGADAEDGLAAAARAGVAADPSVRECVLRLRADAAVVVGSAELPDGRALLAVVEGTPTVQVVDVATCSVLASAPIAP